MIRAMRLLRTTLEVMTIAGAASVVFLAGFYVSYVSMALFFLAGSYVSMALFPIEEPAHWEVVEHASLFTEAELTDQYVLGQTLNTMIYDLEVSLGHAPNYDEHEAGYVLEFYSDYKCEE